MSTDYKNSPTNEYCRLCESLANKEVKDSLGRQLLRCAVCDYVFVSHKDVLSQQEEMSRYAQHENSIADEGYVSFLSRLIEPFVTFLKYGDLVLDYGSGPEPVLAELFRRRGLDVFTYDPFFSPVLHEAVYDGISATEVFEHFSYPKEDIETILSLLSPGGIVGIMTLRHNQDTDFKAWHYTRDPTHIGFFSDKTFRWIELKYSLKLIYDDKERVIIWRKVE